MTKWTVPARAKSIRGKPRSTPTQQWLVKVASIGFSSGIRCMQSLALCVSSSASSMSNRNLFRIGSLVSLGVGSAPEIFIPFHSGHFYFLRFKQQPHEQLFTKNCNIFINHYVRSFVYAAMSRMSIFFGGCLPFTSSGEMLSC